MSKIAEQLEREEDEVEAAGEIAEDIFPVLDELEKKDIIDALGLRIKLFKIFNKSNSKHKNHQDAIYGLFRVSVGASPSGSFIILDPKKALAFLNMKIIGLTKRVILALKETPHYVLNPLCNVVNMINNDKLNQPLKDVIYTRKGSKQVDKKSKDNQRSGA
jgi:hypothetical protein